MELFRLLGLHEAYTCDLVLFWCYDGDEVYSLVSHSCRKCWSNREKLLVRPVEEGSSKCDHGTCEEKRGAVNLAPPRSVALDSCRMIA